jgi:hypothetical protein
MPVVIVRNKTITEQTPPNTEKRAGKITCWKDAHYKKSSAVQEKTHDWSSQNSADMT